MRRAAGGAAVEGSVEGDVAGGLVVPRDIELALRPNEGHCADRPAGTGRIVHATNAEAGPMVCGSRYKNTAAAGSAAGCVPSHVDVVTEGAVQVGVGGDHRFVIEVILTAREGKVGDVRVRGSTIAGARRGHLRAVDGASTPAIAEEDYDVAVKHVTDRVVGQTGIGAEARAGRTDRGRQRQVRPAPQRAHVGRATTAHLPPECCAGSRG